MRYLLITVFSAFLLGCGSSDHIHSATSPNGEYRAIAFFQNTVWSKETHVSIVNSEGGFRYVDGNVLVMKGNIPVWLLWDQSNKLTVEIHGKAERILEKERVSGVLITYEEKI